MRRLILGITLIAGIGLCAKSRPESDMAFINSDASTEANIDKIYKYLKDKKKIPCQLQKSKEYFSFINIHPHSIKNSDVDISLCFQSPDSSVKIQIIHIKLEYELPKSFQTVNNKKKILSLNNQWMTKKTIAYSIIYADGFIVLSHRIYLPLKTKLSVKDIMDSVLKMGNEWPIYYHFLKKKLSLPDEMLRMSSEPALEQEIKKAKLHK